MYYIIGEPNSVNKLQGMNIPELDIRKIRSTQKILVIDDHAFAYKDFLVEKYEFKITKKDDISDISSVSEYGIILCDMDGVGQGIGGKSGGDIITEIRKSYPLKQIVAYTGHKFKASYNRYFKISDRVVEKDIELDEWVELLDGLVKEIVDPIEQWKKTRTLLFDLNISTATVVNLEHMYVNSCLDSEKMNQFKNSGIVKKLNPSAKGIIEGLVINILTRLMIG